MDVSFARAQVIYLISVDRDIKPWAVDDPVNCKRAGHGISIIGLFMCYYRKTVKIKCFLAVLLRSLINRFQCLNYKFALHV